MLKGSPKYAKNELLIGVTIGGDAAESVDNTHLLVVMRVRLLHKIGLYNLTNWNGLKKTARKTHENYSRLLRHF